MDKIINIKCYLLDKNGEEVNVVSCKDVALLMWDNNPSFTIQYFINPENPSSVFLSMNLFRKGKLYVYDASEFEGDLQDENVLKQLQLLFYKYSIQFNPKNNKKDEIYNHVLFLHTVCVQVMNASPFEYEIQNIQASCRQIFMEGTSLMEIFDSIQTWLCIPFIKLSYNNQFYIKQFEYLDSYLKNNEAWDGLSVMKEIEEIKNIVPETFTSSKSKVHLQVYQMYVEKAKNWVPPNRCTTAYTEDDSKKMMEYKICFQKIVDLKEDENSSIHGWIQMNQHCFFTKSFDNLLEFLNIQYKSILYQKETFFSGNILIPFDSLSIETNLSKKRRSQYQWMDNVSKCRQEILRKNIQKFFDMTHFDAIVQFFFYFPNFGLVDNENSFSLFFKQRGISKSFSTSAKMRVSLSKRDIKIQVKKSFGIDNVLEALGIFITFICQLHLRKYYYFIDYGEQFSMNKSVLFTNMNVIRNFYQYSMDEFDTDIFSNIQKSNTLRVETFIPEIKHGETNATGEMSCKEILKYFSYTRYCDKRRMPNFSFVEPDIEKHVISPWPPVEKFNTMNQYTIHVKSPKYEIPIKIIWNKIRDSGSRFIMFVRKQKKKASCVFDEKIIEFPPIFFYIENTLGNYLSVTKLSPAFLPSITVKEKTVDHISTYMSKCRKLQGPLNTFLSCLYNDQEIEFLIDQKYNIVSIMEQFGVYELQKKKIELSIRERIIHNVQENQMYFDIQYLFHYCCHILQANILVVSMKHKHQIPEWKEISPRESNFYFFDRYIILVETLNDKSNNGLILNNYQPIFFKKKNGKDFQFFNKQNSKPCFLEELETIYKIVILKNERLFHHLSLSSLCERISHQILNSSGDTKFLVLKENVFHVCDEIPVLEVEILYKLEISNLPHFSCDKNDLLSVLQTHLYHIWETYDLFHDLQLFQLNYGQLMICIFEIPLPNNIPLGLLFYHKNASEFPIETKKTSEIIFYIKSQIHIDIKYQLAVYRNSFLENKNIKYKLLSSFYRFLCKRRTKNEKTKDCVSKFIHKYIQFKDNYSIGDFKITKKISIPSSYKENLPSYLTWFLSLRNHNTFLKNLYLGISFSFDFEKKKHTLIK
tara:strand:- start:361 stop:3645 length:3285 start_codon:yes stop_codon:yes gene_type:complete